MNTRALIIFAAFIVAACSSNRTMTITIDQEKLKNTSIPSARQLDTLKIVSSWRAGGIRSNKGREAFRGFFALDLS